MSSAHWLTSSRAWAAETLRRAVNDYLAGGDRKERIMGNYGEIGNWDVSKVTDMEGMFQGARSFNQPLNRWNVSKVMKMGWMFYEAESFNQTLHAPWYE